MINKRLVVLGGIAIVAVVLNHAAAYGQIAMILWANQYRAVTVPNYDQVGSFTYYALLAIRQFACFAVPSFLFLSGFFISYSFSGKQDAPKWKILSNKLISLVIPYLIWTCVVYISDAALGVVRTPLQYIVQFFTSGAIGQYYFIPLLCYLYLLSPLIYFCIQKNWKTTLAVAGLIQVIGLIVSYLALVKINSPWITTVENILPDWSVLRWIFYYVLGIAFCFRREQFKSWVETNRRSLLIAAIVFFLCNVVEAEIRFRIFNQDWYPNASVSTITYNLFALASILAFLGYSRAGFPFTRQLAELSAKSFGIYLIHYLAMTYTAKVIYHVVPWVLGEEWLFQPIMIVVGLGGSLLMMDLVIKLLKRVDVQPRYIFG